MPNLLKTDILPITHRRDAPGYEHHEQHNLVNRAVIGQFFDVQNMYGAVGDGVTDDAAAIQEAVDAAEAVGGGIVYLPPGRYLVGDTIDVPSRVVIRGAGMYTTKLFAPASYTNQPMFETVLTADVNEFAQSYGIGFESFTIEDRASTVLNLETSGRSEAHHGIRIHDSDNGWITNVNIADLQGRGYWFEDVAREWWVMNSYAWNCGDGPNSLGALEINSDSGDPTNTIYFYGCRFVFNQGWQVHIGGSQSGIRLINFTDCQIEGGGAGTGVDFGDTAPYDLVKIDRAESVRFAGCNFAGPGVGFHCVFINGDAAANVTRVDFDGCKFNSNGNGGGVRNHRCTHLSLATCHFDNATASEADLYIDTGSGVIYLDPSVIFSPNPFAGGAPTTYVRGRYGDTLTFRDWDITNPGGVFVAPQQMGAIEYLASAAENTVVNYNLLANTLGLAGGVWLRIGGYFDFSGGATTVRIRVKIGGTTVWDATSASLTIANDTPWNMEFIWRNVGLTNSNSLVGSFRVGNATVPTAGMGSFGTQIAAAEFGANTTIDTTADRAIVVTMQLGAARDNVMRGGQLMLF